MADRKQNPKFTTPRVKFIWPVLFEPDYKFNDAGEFRVKAVFSAADLAEITRKLKPIHDQATKEGKEAYAKLPVAARKKIDAKGGFSVRDIYTPVYDDNEEETGEGVISFKSKYKVTRKSDGKDFFLHPDIFDSRGRPLRKKIDVGSGTIGRVTFEAFPYFNPSAGEAGLSYRLVAVQLIDVVKFGSRSATDYGFGEEEGGYDSSFDAEDEDDTENNDNSTDQDVGPEADSSDEDQDF